MKPKICIVISTYNGGITNKLLSSAKNELKKYGITKTKDYKVPGAFEIPVVIARFAKKYDSGKLLDTSINKSTEIGINFWDGDTVNSNSKSSNLSITYSGILSKSFSNNFFLSSGMGIALLSDDKIGERNLGTSLQFESRFEFGYKTINTSSSLNIFHYSNAGAANDNSGVNILMINLSHLF